jgi:hypothetical protein
LTHNDGAVLSGSLLAREIKHEEILYHFAGGVMLCALGMCRDELE